MAPQKTMAVSQQQQQQQQQTTRRSNLGDQAAKSKKRKGKQSSQSSVLQQQQQLSKATPVEKQQVLVKEKSSDLSDDQENILGKNSIVRANLEPSSQRKEVARDQAQAPKEAFNASNSPRSKRLGPLVVAETVLAKQISTEEQDDIDAGIELDGSSNSGSSVKDLSEDQIKSASASPIMAQSNLVNEDRNSTKHAVENAPLAQITGSLCTDITLSKKAGSTTKQQLAANQQVIDADEQSLQQKLQSKQRKSSVQSNTSLASSVKMTSTSSSNGHQGSAPQSPALCKVCEQHVYQMERMMAEKAVYHKSCFRCYQCKTQLRIDNYSSHEGQVYCKAHHRQIFQPQVKLDNEDDVDIVAKSTVKVVDDYLLHRGRLSDLSFSFLQPKPEGIRKRQMIICENEPAELPKDVVRSDTKVDDGIDRLSLNLGNIKERFERGTAGNGDSDSQPSSAGIVIEKPSFNLKKTLMAFETKAVGQNGEDDDTEKRNERVERPTVKRLTNLNGFLERQSSGESESTSTPTKPLTVRRSESLMMRLKKYESRIAGDLVVDDDSEDDENNNKNDDTDEKLTGGRAKDVKSNNVPKKLASIDLSSLKNQWENGDISRRRFNDVDEADPSGDLNGKTTGDNSPSTEKDEELIRIRQQLARKKSGSGSSSIKNIYENAIKEAHSQRSHAYKLNSSDLSALNGFSTIEIQQQLLQNGSQNNPNTPSSPNKDHFQLNLTNKANKLRKRFEQGLITNGSNDDSDANGDDDEPTMTKLEQLRQEKLEDLVWLASKHEGEVQAREARNMFQQIDRRLSNGQSTTLNSRSLSSISASMQAKLQQNQVEQSTSLKRGAHQSLANGVLNDVKIDNHLKYEQKTGSERTKPARLTSFQ